MTGPRVLTELRGEFHGEHVQTMWPGRLCDACRAKGFAAPLLAKHAYDAEGGGRDFYCDDHDRA